MIIINGKERTTRQMDMSFTEVVYHAFPGLEAKKFKTLTVTYDKGLPEKPQGSMVPGDVIPIRDGMIFNVSDT